MRDSYKLWKSEHYISNKSRMVTSLASGKLGTMHSSFTGFIMPSGMLKDSIQWSDTPSKTYKVRFRWRMLPITRKRSRIDCVLLWRMACFTSCVRSLKRTIWTKSYATSDEIGLQTFSCLKVTLSWSIETKLHTRRNQFSGEQTSHKYDTAHFFCRLRLHSKF